MLHLGRLLSFLQTLDLAGKAYQGQTLELIMNICNLWTEKSFITLGRALSHRTFTSVNKNYGRSYYMRTLMHCGGFYVSVLFFSDKLLTENFLLLRSGHNLIKIMGVAYGRSQVCWRVPLYTSMYWKIVTIAAYFATVVS